MLGLRRHARHHALFEVVQTQENASLLPEELIEEGAETNKNDTLHH
jgi:hypothetical protein